MDHGLEKVGHEFKKVGYAEEYVMAQRAPYHLPKGINEDIEQIPVASDAAVIF